MWRSPARSPRRFIIFPLLSHDLFPFNAVKSEKKEKRTKNNRAREIVRSLSESRVVVKVGIYLDSVSFSRALTCSFDDNGSRGHVQTREREREKPRNKLSRDPSLEEQGMYTEGRGRVWDTLRRRTIRTTVGSIMPT